MHRLFILSLAAAALCAPLTAQTPTADATRIYELSEVGTLPRVLNADEFRAALAVSYPQGLRDAGVEGTVTVAFVVDGAGAVREAEVVSTPHPDFGAATVAAVERLRFEPATVDGSAVAVRVAQPVQWRSPPPPAAEAVAATEPAEPVDPELAAMIASAFELKDVDDLPRPTNLDEFRRLLARHYPEAMLRIDAGGRSSARFLIGPDGRPRSISITSASHPDFAAATRFVIGALRFRPARKDGVIVACWVEQPIEWNIEHVRSRGPSDRPFGGSRAPGLRVPDRGSPNLPAGPPRPQ